MPREGYEGERLSDAGTGSLGFDPVISDRRPPRRRGRVRRLKRVRIGQQHRPCHRGPSEVLPFLLSPIRQASIHPRFASSMVGSFEAILLALLTALHTARLAIDSPQQVELPELTTALT